MAYRIGIDIGSKTLKAVVLDEDGKAAFSVYEPHQADIESSLARIADKLRERFGKAEGSVAVTGSAGIGIAERLGLPFVQEVVATSQAVQESYPHADVVVELGGEDAKIIYLTGGTEERMNATCAGGTGAFIDAVAYMVGYEPEQIDAAACAATRSYHIASRCAVFAQTDIRPLLSAGARKEDIVASALDAVVRQTLGGLACGRPLQGTVVFLGGPLHYIPSLVKRFREALELDETDGIVPSDAHLVTARGAALYAAEAGVSMQIGDLADAVADMPAAEDDLEHLEPLFSDEEELAAFRERHAACTFPSVPIEEAAGPLYLGIDAGSTTVKLAVLDSYARIVHSDYRAVSGDAFGMLVQMLKDMYRQIPTGPSGDPLAWIAATTATGYGEDLVREVFGADDGLVETEAHLRAAQSICPDVSFILDIGGQDMKALWVRDGQIGDAVLNEACSSGCGAFIEESAASLLSDVDAFADAALLAENPVDLGTRCTVFMTSRVRHAQKIGASIPDIAAGIAYSVVRNAFYRIIGGERLGSLGPSIVVQGGTFKSDAVLRAFELLSGREVLRCEQAHLMGAVGAAQQSLQIAPSLGYRSGIISAKDLERSKPVRSDITCSGCGNACALSLVGFEGGASFISGNKCDKGRDELRRRGGAASAYEQAVVSERPPNLFAVEQELRAELADFDSQAPRGSVRVGIMNMLDSYMAFPFLYGLATALGFSVRVPTEGCERTCPDSVWETVPSESVCYPAKTTHARYFDLCDKGVDAVLMPLSERIIHCAVCTRYTDALKDNLAADAVPLLTPYLLSSKMQVLFLDETLQQPLFETFSSLADMSGSPLTYEEFKAALETAYYLQQDFQTRYEQATQAAFSWLDADPSRHAILLAGRPYHSDPVLAHGIDEELNRQGFAVFSLDGFGDRARGGTYRRYEGTQPWVLANRILRAAQVVLETPQMDMVCLQSFGCGYDAVSTEEVRSVLEEAGRPSLTVKIDEIVDTAHIRVRLRTLGEAIRSRRLGQGITQWWGQPEEASQNVTGFWRPDLPEEHRMPGEGAATPYLVPLLEGGLDIHDQEIARRDAIKDVCFTANVLAARAIRLVREDPGITTIVLPLVCTQCLTDAIPRMVERATGATPLFIWEDVWGKGGIPGAYHAMDAVEDGCIYTLSEDSEGEAPRPRIGILGNPLLCFDSFMNDSIVEELAKLGCEAVLPDPRNIAVEDVRYLPQLEAFDRAGIHDVIYLLSFGCLKGHVYARGALHEMQERFPQMHISVIDFDSEASSLNRENRIRLIAAAAQSRIPL